MSQPGTTPFDAKDGIVAVALGVLGGLHFAVWLGSALASLAAGHGWHPVAGSRLSALLLGWPAHLSDPRLAFDPRERALLPAPVTLWGCQLLALLLLVTLVGVGVWLVRRAAAPLASRADAAGWATSKQIRRQLGEGSVRRRAVTTRPSVASQRRYPTRQVGLALGTDVRSHLPIWGSVEDSYLVLGPPRSGKGVHLVIPQTLSAPGAAVVTSTRPDTLRATHQICAQRGPVLAFDPQGLADDIGRLRWSPTRGCADPLIAIARARALAAAAQFTAGGTTDGDYWQNMTAAVLRGYLQACALTGRPISDLLAWAARPTDPTPIRILRQESAACPGWAEELAAQASADPRQRDSVWGGVRRAVDSLADPRVLAACSPAPDEQFQPLEFLQARGTLHLLGSTGAQLSVAPLLTALLEDLLDTARRHAAQQPHGRLDPPLFLLLDEVANIAPIPTLPNLLADGGGTGVTTLAVLQSLAQARHRWGEHGADAIWDAATYKIIFGGLANADDLSRISRLCGEVDRPVWSRSTGPGGDTRTLSTQRVPALPIEQIRCLPTGQTLVLARQSPPVQVRLTASPQQPHQQPDTQPDSDADSEPDSEADRSKRR